MDASAALRSLAVLTQSLARDLRYAVRSFLRRPLFAATAVLSLGVGSESLSDMGLVGQYAERQKFADVVKSHLDLVLSRIVSKRDDVKRAAERVGQATIENTGVREQIMSLAREYLRAAHREKAEGTSTSEKGVAAIALLEGIPSHDYLEWLTQRFARERPFVEYHAGVALLNAARAFKDSDRDRLLNLLNLSLSKVPDGTDRHRALTTALAELDVVRPR